ncbi:MAG TPA: START domain-containing protein [Lacibacter sp.]|nr:START domain-containing protein [Lacibacter sp.]HMO88331.1 START domain-containing protein [Lacibacter sp.]HMP85759.1 START domain-containing protein [Lacibacter sp.]
MLLALSCATWGAQAQAQWTLKTDEDGIRLYTRSVAASPYKELKTVCTLHTSLSSVAAVLLDVERTKEWVYGTSSSRILQQESPSAVWFYAEMGMPWPVTNRDFIVRISLTQEPVSKVITVLADNQPDFLPETKKLVRIRHSSGKWRIEPLPGGRVRVEYQLYVDPGGNVPAALVNAFAGKGPVESFRSLRKQVARKEYATAALPFVQN